MSYNLRIWVIDLQGSEEGNHSGTLRGCTSIGIIAFFVQATLITDANGVGIVVEGMHTDFFLWAGLIDLTIALNVIVVADAFAVESGIVTATEHLNGKPLVAARSRTVNDDKGNLSCHSLFILYTLARSALYSLYFIL
jgi:hypothetical protein